MVQIAASEAVSPDVEGKAFALSPDQQLMLDEADRFARNELYPLAAKMDDDAASSSLGQP